MYLTYSHMSEECMCVQMCVCKKCVHEKKIKMGQGWGCSSSGKAFAKQGPWVPSLATQKKERGKIRTDDSA